MARLTVGLLCVNFGLLATPALAQNRLGGGGALDISLTRIVMALLLCTMIAAVAALTIKRSGGRVDLAPLRRRFLTTFPVERRIEIVESRRVSTHADICLIRCSGREYLILCGPVQQTLLREGAVSDGDVT